MRGHVPPARARRSRDDLRVIVGGAGRLVQRAGARCKLSDLFDVDERALARSSRPIALTVSPSGGLGVVEVTTGVIAEVVDGPHVDTVSSGHGTGFWFNAVDQHRHPVNKVATLLLLATAGLAAGGCAAALRCWLRPTMPQATPRVCLKPGAA